MKVIVKKSYELMFECPDCSTIWVEDKQSCKAIPHDGMVDGVTYTTNCPECGKEVFVFRIEEKE